MKSATAFAAFVGVIVFSAPSFASGDTPRPAQDIMSAAQKESRAKHKPILVLFDASW